MPDPFHALKSPIEALSSGRGSGAYMKFKIIVHEAEEGGFWAEVPAVPGCASQGETMDELMINIREAIEGCLSVDVDTTSTSAPGRVFEIAV
jgi:predicted RNase H-like HicB family nuclease